MSEHIDNTRIANVELVSHNKKALSGIGICPCIHDSVITLMAIADLESPATKASGKGINTLGRSEVDKVDLTLPCLNASSDERMIVKQLSLDPERCLVAGRQDHVSIPTWIENLAVIRERSKRQKIGKSKPSHKESSFKQTVDAIFFTPFHKLYHSAINMSRGVS